MNSRSASVMVALTTVVLVSAIGIARNATGNTADKREQLRRLHDQIRAEVGTPSAERLEQCRTIALGVKPCGGPWHYLVYSIVVSNEPRLTRLVAEYNELERKLNAEEGRASDCSVVLEPKVALADGVCAAAKSR